MIEGLKTLRVVLEPNPHGLDFDLIWQGSIPAQLEPPHLMRMQERVIIDSARLAQTGRWSGQIRSGGEVFEVTPEHWQGSREDPRTTSRAISQTVGRNPDAYGHS